MRYDLDSGRILITTAELVATARRGISPTPVYDDDEPLGTAASRAAIAKAGGALPEPFSYDFSVGEYNFTLSDEILTPSPGLLVLAEHISGKADKPKRQEYAQLRGKAFILGYVHAMRENLDSVNLSITVIGGDGCEKTHNERVEADKLTQFFNKCTATLSVLAAPEIERVTERLPSMSAMKFPYPNIREGQREFIRSAYRLLSRGGNLYATAPTGTGKTVSALYPALRAMGDGRIDKVFYFTPKTTTAEAARDCLELMAARGVKIKAIVLSAKEKCCRNGLLCRESRRLCKNATSKKLTDAALELYRENATVVEREAVVRMSKKWQVCPYELSLTYAELCDVVIGDFNYLFSPTVYIKRFFGSHGRYGFLVDEAHNLSERVREAYSAEISTEEISAPAESELLGEHSLIKQLAARAAKVFSDTVMPLVREEIRQTQDGSKIGTAHTSEPPARLYTLFDELRAAIEAEILDNYAAKDEEVGIRVSFLRDYLRKITAFSDALARFDDAFSMFVFYENARLSVKLYCLDTGPIIRERLSHGHGAVLFSATLSPLGYYRQILGGERSDEVLEVSSPFAPEQLSVAIMDKISTRYSEREDTLLAVCRVIAATISARRGNYMIFSPSFAYSEALSRAFKAKYPKLHIITQRRDMSQKEKEDFLAEFRREDKSYLVAFCVMGGIYSEGIDLAGDSLIGAVVVGTGIPAISYEREAIAAYYQEKFDEGQQYAYIYPGMNRVFQAAGRVIRREDDRGVIVLIDDRFDDPIYKKSLPDLWEGVRFISDAKELRAELDEFWNDEK